MKGFENMENYKKAEELYLRGFCGEYIKRRTGVSIQSLLKCLLSQGVKYTKDDIVNFQIQYIRQHFSIDDVERAYTAMSERYPVLEKVARRKHIELLGCGFGDYTKVFCALLGSDRYRQLKVDCWKKKQESIMMERYHVKNAFEKQSCFMTDNPMLQEDVKEKRRQTMLARYGCEHPNQNPEIKAKMMMKKSKTMLEKYGVEYPTQMRDVAMKVAESRQATMLKRYGAPNSVQVEDIRNQIFEERKKNGTLNSSKAEDVLYDMLVAYFGEIDVLRNVCVDDRYPYHVDFYIKSRDLFIELNGDKCHYTHWFNSKNEKDLQVLQSWMENAERLEKETGRKSRYVKYIETWTGSDVLKRQCAKQNQLNYIVFWDGSRKIQKNKRQFPRLQDAREWFAAGCPDSFDWKSENTY